MLVAQGAFPHVGQLDGSLAASVHEPVAALRVELCRGNDLGQLLHVGRLDVDNVEALVLDVEVPQVDAQVVAADKRLAVAVDRDAVDVICVSVGVHSPRNGGNDRVVMCHAWEVEVCGRSKVLCRSDGSSAIC